MTNTTATITVCRNTKYHTVTSELRSYVLVLNDTEQKKRGNMRKLNDALSCKTTMSCQCPACSTRGEIL